MSKTLNLHVLLFSIGLCILSGACQSASHVDALSEAGVTDFEIGDIRRQSGGTCTDNAVAMFIELLHRRTGGVPIRVYSDYWTFFRWYDSLRALVLVPLLSENSFSKQLQSSLRTNHFSSGTLLSHYSSLVVHRGLMLEENSYRFGRLAADVEVAIRGVAGQTQSFIEAATQELTRYRSALSREIEGEFPAATDAERKAILDQVSESYFFLLYARTLWATPGAEDVDSSEDTLFRRLSCALLSDRGVTNFHATIVNAFTEAKALSLLGWSLRASEPATGPTLPAVCPGIHDVHDENDPVLQVLSIDSHGQPLTLPLIALLSQDYIAPPPRQDEQFDLYPADFAGFSPNKERTFWLAMQRTLHAGLPVLTSLFIEEPYRRADISSMQASPSITEPSLGGWHAMVVVDYRARAANMDYDFGPLSPALGHTTCQSDATSISERLQRDDIEVTDLRAVNSWGNAGPGKGLVDLEVDYLREPPSFDPGATPAKTRLRQMLVPYTFRPRL